MKLELVQLCCVREALFRYGVRLVRVLGDLDPHFGMPVSIFLSLVHFDLICLSIALLTCNESLNCPTFRKDISKICCHTRFPYSSEAHEKVWLHDMIHAQLCVGFSIFKTL